MAICFVRASIIKRSAGRSAVAAAAYRAGEKLVDLSTGEIHNYTRKTGIDHSEIISPIAVSGDNNWLLDRSALWNQVQDSEKRCDAQLARELIIAIPRELDRESQFALVREYIKSSYVDRGMVADINCHNLNSDNPHAHVMLTMRQLQIDEQGRVIFGLKDRSWNDKKLLATQVKEWEILANRYLEQAGLEDVKIDSRSYEEQGINRIPQIHLGAHAASMRAKGIPSRIGDEYDRIDAANNDIRQQLEEIYNDELAVVDLNGQCENLNAQISDLETEVSRDLSFSEKVDPDVMARIKEENEKFNKKPNTLTSEDLMKIVSENRAKRIVEWAAKNLVIPDGQTSAKHESNSVMAKMSAINIDPNTVAYIFTDTITEAQLKITCSKSSSIILSMAGSITGAISSQIKAVDRLAIEAILNPMAKIEEVANPEAEPTAQVSTPEVDKTEIVNIPEAEKIELPINQPPRRVVIRGRSHELG